MIYLAVYATYVLLMVNSFYRFSRVNIRAINFVDGLLFSQAYYLLVPMGLILWDEKLKAPEMMSVGYYPFENIYTTYTIFLGCFLIQIFHLVWPILFPARRPPRARADYRLDLACMFGILIFLEIYTVYASGRLSGGHWQEALSEALQTSSTLILLSNFLNAYRALIFGLIFFVYLRGGVQRKTALALGVAVGAIDVLLTLNRISVAYFYILILMLYWDRVRYVLLATLVAIPIIAPLSSAWTFVRAQALYDGYSVAGFSKAFDDAIFQQSGASKEPIALAANSIFETTNIQVLHNIVERFPSEYPLFYGWTYFLRPVVIFIPSTIWPGKPSTFGVFVGESLEKFPGLALNSTFIGEPYGNFYLLWPLAFMLMLFCLSSLFRWLSNFAPYAGPMAFFSGFALGRFEITYATVCVLAIFVFIMLMTGARVLRPKRALNRVSMRQPRKASQEGLVRAHRYPAAPPSSS
jgi:hypothetical protein